MRAFRHTLTGLAVSALVVLAACGSGQKAPGEEVEGAGTIASAACPRPANPEAHRAEMAATEARLIAEAEASRGAGSPAVWTLRDEDTTLYILGTVHLLRPELEWRTAEIDAAIAAADTIIFEADTTSPDAGRELMAFFTKEGMFNDGTQLSSLLSAEEKAQLEEALDAVGLPLAAVEAMKPWFAAINMTNMQILAEGFDPNSGVEKMIEASAAAHGASFEYLETVEQQLGEFARMETCAQIEFLLQSAEAVKQGTGMLDLLVAEWADGDVNGIGILMGSPDAFGSRDAYDAMLKNRNERWVPQIAAMLDEPGTRLIAAGAGHFAGEDSVITLLRAEGFEVEGP
ncbi:MAG TPA: TraB/GumN family protein [Hyphomonas sp.]|nr:TraB/GumN family protein [Hyphomonas sp.]HRK69553.1 TraB/GumN family protein [Hyphomonas sp.]